MPRTLAIIGVLLAVLLGSCVSRPAAPGFAWSFQNNDGEGPKLAYGQPSSDNIVLMMTCNPGARQIGISLVGGSPGKGFVLASGERRQSFGGVLVASPGMGQMIEASADPASELLARFARTGDLTLINQGRPLRLDASPLERPGVTRFFEACRA